MILSENRFPLFGIMRERTMMIWADSVKTLENLTNMHRGAAAPHQLIAP